MKKMEKEWGVIIQKGGYPLYDVQIQIADLSETHLLPNNVTIQEVVSL